MIQWEIVAKGEFNNLVTHLCKLLSHNFFDFILNFHLLYTYGKATDQPCVNDSKNPEFIREKNLKPTSYPVEFTDYIFPVYKKKMVGTKRHPHFSLHNNF